MFFSHITPEQIYLANIRASVYVELTCLSAMGEDMDQYICRLLKRAIGKEGREISRACHDFINHREQIEKLRFLTAGKKYKCAVTENFTEIFARQNGMTGKTYNLLDENDLCTLASLLTISDCDFLEIAGVGIGTLQNIKEFIKNVTLT